MIKAMGLKLWRRGHIQWHDLTAKFHKNLLISSKADRGKDTHTQTETGVLINRLFFPLGRKAG
jgi:hypothetical protein